MQIVLIWKCFLYVFLKCWASIWLYLHWWIPLEVKIKPNPLPPRNKNVSELLRYYPELKSVNDSGKEVTEYSNKYWVMLDEVETAEVYPEKGMQK